jgi:hypothetical protein
MKKPRWTCDDLTLMHTRYPHESTATLAAELGRSVESVYQCAMRLELVKTPEFMASPAAGRIPPGGDHRGQRFLPGHQAALGNRSQTGKRNPRRAALGTVITSGSLGYAWIKVLDLGSWPQGWRPLHHVVWEQAHGPIPPEHLVTFRDGNRANVVIENLELVDKVAWMLRHSISSLPPELASLMRLKAKLVRTIAQREEIENAGEPPRP